MNKAVQQTLIDYTNPTLAMEGILEYKFSHPELSDSEERKDNSDNGADSPNPGSDPVATLGREGRPRGKRQEQPSAHHSRSRH